MYAVVTTGGKQYRVSPGDRIDVEKLTGEVGETVALAPVMMVGQGADVTIGAPTLDDARVEAQIIAHKRGKKIIIFKYRRRKGYRRKQGHRQSLTSLQITGIHTATSSFTIPAVSIPAPASPTAVAAVAEPAAPSSSGEVMAEVEETTEE